MDKQTVIRTGVAGAVAAAGLAVGGVAMATTDDSKGATGTYGPRGEGGGPGGPGGHGPGGFGFGPDKAAFAKALGVSEEKLTTALETIREDAKGQRGEGERPGRDAIKGELVSALAKELGISEEKVQSAVDDLQADAKADRRAKLEERLDEAVTDGDLTDADKASVLKAYDAGVLGPNR